MFTGLVEEVGRVRRARGTAGYQLLEVEAHRVLQGTSLGDSISLDGTCQTVTDLGKDYFAVETLAVSLEKTTLGEYRPGRPVNLERALTPQSRMGGHFVQGHVDAVAKVAQVREERENVYFTVTVSETVLPYCVDEGSIAIDGVSLTIAALSGTEITINVIPSTWKSTVLPNRGVGERVNIEVDIIGRYVARMLGLTKGASRDHNGGEAEESGGLTTGLSAERLRNLGY